MKRYFGKNKENWAERKRVWKHPYIGRRFHDIRRGYGTFKKVWKERRYLKCCPDAPLTFTLTYEVEIDGGLRYIEEGFRLMPNIQFEDGYGWKGSSNGDDLPRNTSAA